MMLTHNGKRKQYLLHVVSVRRLKIEVYKVAMLSNPAKILNNKRPNLYFIFYLKAQ